MSAVDVSAGALCDVAWVSAVVVGVVAECAVAECAVAKCAVDEPECLW